MGDRRETRDRTGRRVLLASIVASLLLHLVLAVADPPLRLPGAENVAVERIELLPPPEERPPALEIPAASAPIPPPARPVVSVSPVVEEESAQPAFVPHDVPPRLLNPAAVQEYLQAFYPPELRAVGIAGSVDLLLFVDAKGDVAHLRLRSSSGSRSFDELARSAAGLMRFRPAISGERTVGVWVAQPLTFRTVPAGSAELASR